ncbi:TetR/AcrR family transcriptional regulator [Devosia sp.]|uniref:TetR/AcrR family transcriptional regulator n=1 Tax=Devosia sp. TaxID=1871048 RepID=UPI003A9156C0
MKQAYHHGALREALIAAAGTILERDGITALTLRAAAREAGVSHAAPAHHFGSLAGLLSELAAAGFVRFRETIAAEVAAAAPTPDARALAVSRGYVGFARAAPGLFRLMFRSEQLDWTNAALEREGAAAFMLLLPPEADDGPVLPTSPQALNTAMAHWSMVHGLASLLIDGRLQAVASKMHPGVDIEQLIAQIIRTGAG